MSQHNIKKVAHILMCNQCGGIDKSFTTHCPNHPYKQPVTFHIIDGELDYFDGKWTGTVLALQKLEQQLFQLGYCHFPDNNHTPLVSTNTTSVYLDDLGYIELGEEDEL